MLVIDHLPATTKRLQEIKCLQEQDETCQKLKLYRQNGWPARKHLSDMLKYYIPVKNELSVNNGILLRGNRLIIPSSLRPEIIENLHSGHQGFTKCQQRAKDSVWWPDIKDIEEKVSKCIACSKHRLNHVEPLLLPPFPNRPWEKVGTDIFEWRNSSYLLVMDYYSRYIEVAKLSSMTSQNIVQHLKSIFARHGTPETVISGNGPQYSVALFKLFSEQCGFTHVTSSPIYPQANGAAERAVRTVKGLLNKSDAYDPYLAVLAYCSTPLENGYSPAELLMGRQLRTTIPVLPKQLKPKLPDANKLGKMEKSMRKRQKINFDQRHRAKDLIPLQKGQSVWIIDIEAEGVITRTIQQILLWSKHLTTITDETEEI